MSKQVEYHVLNLGAGVQSTTLYEMFNEGLVVVDGKPVKLDVAINADTQDEPQAVYRHLEHMQKRGGPPIWIRTKGRISDHLLGGQNSTGHRFASIPAFVQAEPGAEPAKTRRQCSKEYKIEVIERAIRRELLGLKPKQRVPKGVIVHQYIGISLDEAGRAMRIRQNLKHKWVRLHFPLIEQFFFTRPMCKQFLEARYDYEIPRSACVYCPFRDDNSWIEIKKVKEDWDLAVKVDEGLRMKGTPASRKIIGKLFLHRSCQPLTQIEFKPNEDPRANQLPMNFNQECMGVCGV